MAWVRLDDTFPEHRKTIAAGTDAAWLHVSALCYCNRNETDGVIPTGALGRLTDLRRPGALAGRLVDVGLWELHPDGWQIHDYLEYQPSRQKLDADRQKARERMANHRRSSPDVRPNTQLRRPVDKPETEREPDACYTNVTEVSDGASNEDGGPTRGPTRTDPQVLDPRSPDVRANNDRSSGGSSPYPVPSRPVVLTVVESHQSSTACRGDDDDDDFSRTVELIVDARIAGRRIENPRAYRQSARANTSTEDGELIRRMLTDGTTPEHVALFVLGHGTTTEPERSSPTIPWCGPDCPTCEGDAWIDTGNGLAPCPNRQAS